MIKKYWYELILITITALAVGIFVGAILYSDDIKHLKNEVVEAYDSGFEDGYQKGTNDLLEDYYEVLIEYAVLEERLKHQPSDEEYIQQILDDVELVIKLQRHYYEQNVTTHSFGHWLQIYYPALYARIESYY